MNMNARFRATVITVIAALFLGCSFSVVNAQTNLETFGQNRIQYRKFDWKYFDTKHFRIYHYDAAGRQLARYVAEQVENDITVVEQKMGGEFPHRFKIVVYNSYDEYRQTNIGRKFDSQLQDIPAGTVDVVGDKLTVYFSGVHTDLRRQTRAGMSRVIMERILFGDNFREVVRNAVLMNLPSWTVYGYISYLVDGWDAKSNSDWKNMLQAKPKAGFYELAEKQPELAGKAFWKYVTDKYGETTTKNVLYTMQLKSNLNQGLKIALGQNAKKAYDSTMTYFRQIYAKDEEAQEKNDEANLITEVPIPKDGSVIRSIRVSPRGTDVAYVSWKRGEFAVRIVNAKGEKNDVAIVNGGKVDFNELPDPDYPMLVWSNNGYKLAVLYKKRNNTIIKVFNAYSGKIETYTIPPNRFDRVLSMTFNEDDDRLVFSAIKKSQTDLYEFIIRGAKMKNITNDAWDDIQPSFVSGGSRRGIIFLSNRPKPNIEVPLGVNELPNGPMNVFFYNTKTKRKELLQMSKVTSGNVTQPMQYGTENYAYLYDSNGIVNEYLVLMNRTSNNMDSASSVPVTNHTSNIVTHQYDPAGNMVTEIVQEGDKYKVYKKVQQQPKKGVDVKQLSPTLLQQAEGRRKTTVTANEAEETAETMKSGNAFQSEFKDDNATTHKKKKKGAESIDAEINVKQAADSEYLKMKAQPYKLAFKPDFITIRLDNSVLFNKYQSVAQTGGKFINPSLAGMLTVSLNDLMEDYRITGGIRLPINFSGTTYFMQYENAKKRVDWSLMYLRSESQNTFAVAFIDTSKKPATMFTNEQIGKTTTNLFQGTASYPLDRMSSIRMNLGFRTDVLNFRAQDILSLAIEPNDKRQNWLMSRVEYVFDNTIKPSLNIYNGVRYKVYGEYMYRLNGTTGGFYNLGADIRTYKKLYRNFIWATRFAGASSGGDMKILYHIGGVDNWVNAKYSDYVPVRPFENYAFEALANNLRGYEQNSRNGNTYALVNTELRLPIFTTFIKRPIQSSVVKNMQLVVFADAGSAWRGTWPDKEGLRNNKILPNPLDPTANNQVQIIIKDESGGVGLGYGGGLRTMVFGYFLRVDAGWNIENHKKSPLIHFSIGADF